MTEYMRQGLEMLLGGGQVSWSPLDDQRHAILRDLIWKLIRRDYHGVADCANDLRELEARLQTDPYDATLNRYWTHAK